ncbi:hypothetical protein S40293_10650 [Stachybotrys chartarum IBT 40293]|nr:hypothetical protein S40293_10650 [Stachybotrys chartarum IBT 40293]
MAPIDASQLRESGKPPNGPTFYMSGEDYQQLVNWSRGFLLHLVANLSILLTLLILLLMASLAFKRRAHTLVPRKAALLLDKAECPLVAGYSADGGSLETATSFVKHEPMPCAPVELEATPATPK